MLRQLQIVLMVGALAALFACAPAVDSQPVAVQVDDSIVMQGFKGRDMQLRVVYPETGDTKAVIVLSHGTFSSGKRYDSIAKYWASYGYAVILPDHRDANYGAIPKRIEDMFETIDTRINELTIIADGLATIEAAIPALAGKLQGKPLVAAGHSVGTQVSMQSAGLRFRNGKTGEVRGYDEDRYVAVILLSDPGKMAMMPDEMWQAIAVPTFMVTGPDDYGLMGDTNQKAEFQNEVLVEDGADDTERYLLLITEMDHQFGGLIHKDLKEPKPDHEALALFNEYSLAFLEAVVMDSSVARAKLQTKRLSDRAELIKE